MVGFTDPSQYGHFHLPAAEVNSVNGLKIERRHIRIECFSLDAPNRKFGLALDRVGVAWMRGRRDPA
jgi:hypothetical protein